MKNTKVLSGIVICTIATFLLTAMIASTSDAEAATSTLRLDRVQVRALRQVGAHLVQAPVALVSRDQYLVERLVVVPLLLLVQVGLAVADKPFIR